MICTHFWFGVQCSVLDILCCENITKPLVTLVLALIIWKSFETIHFILVLKNE